MHLLSLLLASTLALSDINPSYSFDDQWNTDFAAAKKMAQADDTFLLIDFTGSDWCAPCNRLRKDILDRQEFREQAKAHFTFVEVDFPQKTKLDPQLASQNQELKRMYQVTGYPTVVLADWQGMPFAMFAGYTEKSIEMYWHDLQTAIENKEKVDAMLTDAASATGRERHEALHEAVRLLADQGVNAAAFKTYRPYVEEIASDESTLEASLKVRYQEQLAMTDILRAVIETDYAQIVTLGNKFLERPNLSAELQHEVYYHLYLAYKQLGDKRSALKVARAGIAVSPTGKYQKYLQTGIEWTLRLNPELDDD